MHRLYAEVAQRAPECQALAGRVKQDMDAAVRQMQSLGLSGWARHQRLDHDLLAGS